MSDAQQPSAPADVNDLFDLTIIGAGPVGLFGAFYAGMRGMKVKLVDSLAELGGQLSALYPDKYIFDMAGFPKVIARDLVRDLSEQALQFHPTVCLEEKVMTLAKTDEGFEPGHREGPHAPHQDRAHHRRRRRVRTQEARQARVRALREPRPALHDPQLGHIRRPARPAGGRRRLGGGLGARAQRASRQR